MNKVCILSDFDGTITVEDGLYSFFVQYASSKWREIEYLWTNHKIGSKECLYREFACVPNLNEKLICDYTKSVKIDSSFNEFFNVIQKKGIDFFIVSDGADYFIKKILSNNGINNINIISNHLEFENDKFILSFPNDFSNCATDAGTCKCKVISKMKEKYDKVIYIGDGISDFCAAKKADILFAKKKLINYCKEQNINYIEFQSFKDIENSIFSI